VAHRRPGGAVHPATPTPTTIPSASSIPLSGGGGDGGGGKAGGGGGGLGGGGDGWVGDGAGGGDDDADGGDGAGKGEAFLSLAAATAAASAAGVALPPEFAAAAAGGGLRSSALSAYLSLMRHASPLTAAAARALPAVRARLLRDPRFLFKVGAEVAIDAGCATVAEVRKRGPEFWDEFEFYLSDLLVGCVLDVVLVTLMAPAAVLGRAGPRSAGFIASRSPRLAAALERVPSAVLEASPAGGPRYSPAARAACLGVKFGEYSLAGMACGAVGQAIANGLMAVKRAVGESRAAAAGKAPPHPGLTPPPVGLTALTWGLFMGASSNVRYQIVYGLERAVDVTLARAFPPAAYAATLAFRFANNVIGGENFIDMARWTGIQ
jgi:hypothetical protein